MNQNNILMNKYINKFGPYWYYEPYNIYIPINKFSIPPLYNDGNQLILHSFDYTQMNQRDIKLTDFYYYGPKNHLSLEQYYQIHCELINDKWYFI